MAKPNRELAYAKRPDFTGWICRACDWKHPSTSGSNMPDWKVQAAFEQHKCNQDARQAAARIVRETREDK
jgi:hypothetical protein